MRCRCRKWSERGHVPDVDIRPDHLYGDAGRSVCHGYSIPKAPGTMAGGRKPSGSRISADGREGGFLAGVRRNRGWADVSSDQQSDRGRHGVRRRLCDTDTGNLPWTVGATDDAGRGILSSGCVLHCRAYGKEDVQGA